MKISHTNLETVRKNPKQYLRQVYSNNTRIFFSLSAYRILQFAIRHYHNNSDNQILGIQYLERMFRDKFKSNSRNEKRLSVFSGYLSRYFNSYERLGNHVTETGVNVKIDFGKDIYICGEIFRIDLVVRGNAKYAVFLLVKEDYDWKTELRMPILQRHYSKIYNCSLNEISVGVYCLSTNRHESVCFSEEHVNRAIEEMRSIVDLLSEEEIRLKKQAKEKK